MHMYFGIDPRNPKFHHRRSIFPVTDVWQMQSYSIFCHDNRWQEVNDLLSAEGRRSCSSVNPPIYGEWYNSSVHSVPRYRQHCCGNDHVLSLRRGEL